MALEVPLEFPRERGDWAWKTRVEHEVHVSSSGTLDGASLLLHVFLRLEVFLDCGLLLEDAVKLLVNLSVNIVCCYLLIDVLFDYVVVELVLIGDFQLVLKSASPEVVLSQVLHSVHEAVAQEALGDVQALELVHGLELLFSAHSGLVQDLVLLLDPLNLALDLVLPVRP